MSHSEVLGRKEDLRRVAEAIAASPGSNVCALLGLCLSSLSSLVRDAA